MPNTNQLLAVIKASIKSSGNCAVPFFALIEIFPVIRDEAMEAGRLPANICERIRTLCNTEQLTCRYDEKRKVVIFNDAQWAAASSSYLDTHEANYGDPLQARCA